MSRGGYYKKLDCPIHKEEMYFAPHIETYACQNSDCKYATGCKEEDIEPSMMDERSTDVRRSLNITNRWYPR